ncbi:MAG: alpha/beta hydrolase [Intrasporangium sp.]|uniref:alpha/beta fold hydrolase n=1 Tax=Intrasporangium sp. TaxID=1925024 RepID=UPI002647D28E|nr:alpha/beta hydrolase [Intrasporangium sp.]MDN5795223.1 alpha/beta hydrolase [Intrasporangium sp.]
MPSLRAAGPAGSIGYEVTGSGPGVVLVHGWCCDRTYLEPQQAHLSRLHAVVALDLRGHGASEQAADAGYSIEDFADDVAAVTAASGLERPVVIGHSMGGLVALECAARGLACAAVLLEPAAILDQRGKDYFLRSVPAVAKDTDGAWRRRFAERIMLPTDTARRDEILAGMPLTDVRVAAAAMRGMGEYDAAAALRRVEVPVLVIVATSPEDLDAVRSLCPTVTTGQTVGAGHFHQLEVPEQVNLMIDRFLALDRL